MTQKIVASVNAGRGMLQGFEPRKLFHTNVNPVTLIGGPADGRRVTIADKYQDRQFIQMTVVSQLQTDGEELCYETAVYKRKEFIADDWLFVVWHYDGMTSDQVMMSLLKNYHQEKPVQIPLVRLPSKRLPLFPKKGV